MADTYDYLLKFIIIGDAATGKSCLLHRFIDNKCAWDGVMVICRDAGRRVLRDSNV